MSKRTYYGCPECGYRVVSQETGMCPSCDEGRLGDVVDTTPWSDSSLSKSRHAKVHNYFRVRVNNAGRPHSFNVRAVSPARARKRAITVCRQNGWTIWTPEGNSFNRTDPDEPEHSIDVVRLDEAPSEHY